MSDRSLRHKTVPVYDDDEQVENEIAGNRTYDVTEKLFSRKYCDVLITEMDDGTELRFEDIQKNGFNTPLKIKNNKGLGMTLPEGEFTVSNVKSLVGSRRMVDVMECKTQRALEMSMKDFERYFTGVDRTQVYNVISLEFSHSKLEPYVKRPKVVDCMDWIDLAWPRHLKEDQTEQSNSMLQMKYPKVQKYCLMSVGGCYTDFHIDFGGTSVWYHILKGGKVFWLIPPTETNLRFYEKWTLSGNQGDVFFGDLVEKCERVHLQTGDSLMIPSGWIHSVYTSEDSLVFGGNFLNSFNIPMQIKVAEIEAKLKVPPRFRFPFFNELNWYVLDRYVHCLMGVSFMSPEYKTLNGLQISENFGDVNEKTENGFSKVNLTSFELEGLSLLVKKLESLPISKRCIPSGIVDPEGLIRNAKLMLAQHKKDDFDLAATGKAVVSWPIRKKRKEEIKPRKLKAPSAMKVKPLTVKKTNGRVRRVRCKKCEACLREDCRMCNFCRDMKKFGGPGTMKQTCEKRKCLNPILPSRMKEEVPLEVVPPVAVQVKIEQPDTSFSSHTESDVDEPLNKVAKIYKSEFKQESSLSSDEDNGSQPPLPRLVVKRVNLEEKQRVSVSPASSEVSTISDSSSPIVFDKNIWMNIMKYLPQDDLRMMSCVNKSLLTYASDRQFWKHCDYDNQQLDQNIMEFLVRRSPKSLSIAKTNISYDDLLWLVRRLPELRVLNLSQNSWSCVAALTDDSCPHLTSLDISWVEKLADEQLNTLLSLPSEVRPGRLVPQLKMGFCRDLNLSGLNITNVSLKLIANKLLHLEKINISFCPITDEGIKFLCSGGSDKLHTILAKCCANLTNETIVSLENLSLLKEVDLSRCMKISPIKCLILCQKKIGLRQSVDPKHLISV